ncbi:MAG: hypothetical protein WBL28_03175 [Methylotenera sp.]
MANPRSHVKRAHEKFTVGLFLDNFNRCYHTDFKVVDEPVSCEAIIQSKKSTRWVEVTDACLSNEFATDIYSYATPGETHKPSREGLLIGPDTQFAKQFVTVVKQKLEKSTYEPFREKYGQGYLIVSIQYPLYGQGTLRYIRRTWDEIQINDKNCFRSIYIAYRTFNGYKVSLWKPNTA